MVAEREVGVAGRDLGVHDHHAVGGTVLQRVHAGLHGERGGRACHVHVVAPATGSERILDLHGHRRVGPLDVRAADNDAIDLVGAPAGLCQGLVDGGQGHLGLQPELVLRAQRQVRAETVRVEHTALLHHEATLDPRGLLDELGVGQRARDQFAVLDLAGVLLVPAVHRDGQRGSELRIADGVRRREQPRPRDDDIVGNHAQTPLG
ncbi:MAG: hypothetical protein RLZZ623_1264 [Actinomycetota bacterium]